MGFHIFPRGNDRSWTRSFYYTINRVSRRIAYEEHFDKFLTKALLDSFNGIGYIKIGGAFLEKDRKRLDIK